MSDCQGKFIKVCLSWMTATVVSLVAGDSFAQSYSLDGSESKEKVSLRNLHVVKFFCSKFGTNNAAQLLIQGNSV